MVVQWHSHLGFFNIQNEGFSYVPALNASLMQSLLSQLHPPRWEIPNQQAEVFSLLSLYQLLA